MDEIGTAEVGALFGAAGVLLFLLADRRSLLLAGLAAVAAAEALLIAPSVSATVLAGLGVAGLAVLAAGAAVFVRYPALLTPVVLAVAPFRTPFEFDRGNRFFIAVAEQGELGRLLPLYGVLGAAALALAWRTVRGEPVRELPRELSIPAAAFLALASASLLWTVDRGAGIDLLRFFLLPFALLLGTVARAPFPSWMPRVLATIAVVLASIFAVVGLVEAATHRVVFGATATDVSNSFRGFFRVTSLFRDPSIYGRHLVLALVVVIAAMLLSRLDIRLAAAFIVLFAAALFFTYSQSSMAALFVAALALLVVAAPTRLRLTLAVAAVALVAVTAVAIAADVRDQSTRRVTSGRSLRVEDAARAIADRPVVGAGIGGQPAASRRLADRNAGYRAFVSHTTPLTVAAELGVVGILLYTALLAGAAWTIDQVRRRDRALGLTLGAALLALFVHALAYAGFFEDPLTWFILAVAASALAGATATGRASSA
jgi:O-antigen ligase